MHCYDAESIKRVSASDVAYTLHDFSTVDGQENFIWKRELGQYIIGIEPATTQNFDNFLTLFSMRAVARSVLMCTAGAATSFLVSPWPQRGQGGGGLPPPKTITSKMDPQLGHS
jgi:hypothetical protein